MGAIFCYAESLHFVHVHELRQAGFDLDAFPGVALCFIGFIDAVGHEARSFANAVMQGYTVHQAA